MSEPDTTVSVARVATDHFEFLAIGADPDDARERLMEAWYLHADDTDADPDYLSREDVNVITGPIGSTFRDGSVFPRP